MYFNIVILLSDGGTLLNSVPVNYFTFVLLSLSFSGVPPRECVCCNVFVSDMFYETKVLHKGSYQGCGHIGCKCYSGCNHLHQMWDIYVSLDIYN
jgi:hypothetical protein